MPRLPANRSGVRYVTERGDAVCELPIVALLRAFDRECGIEDHGMTYLETKNGVVQCRVGSFVSSNIRAQGGKR